MQLAKVSLSTLVLVGLGAGLFIIARRKYPAPVVNTNQRAPIFTGASDTAFINGPGKMLDKLAASLPKSVADKIGASADRNAGLAVFLNNYSFLDNDRAI